MTQKTLTDIPLKDLVDALYAEGDRIQDLTVRRDDTALAGAAAVVTLYGLGNALKTFLPKEERPKPGRGLEL